MSEPVISTPSTPRLTSISSLALTSKTCSTLALDIRPPRPNPRGMPKWRKWLTTLTVCLSALCVTCTSSIYTTLYPSLIKHLSSSDLLNVGGLSIFVLGMGLGPVFLSPLSEFYGRRIVYICSFVTFTGFLFPCVFAPNMGVLLAARFVTGLAGSAFLSVAGGTVGDLFEKEELGAPMMVFTVSPFVGPVLGPLVGGVLAGQEVGWRWTFGVMGIWAGVQTMLIFLCVPETYLPVLVARWEQPDRKVEKKEVLRTVAGAWKRPLKMLVFEPMLACLCGFAAVLLGILYLFFQAFPIVFGRHGMNVQQTGYMFLGLLIGMLLATLSDPLWRRIYTLLVTRHTTPEPEFRLPCGILGGAIIPLGLFIFAWTAKPEIHWTVPVVGAGMFAAGTVLVFQAAFVYQVESYPLYAASALAANSFSRSVFAAAFPMFSGSLYEGLGVEWAGTVLACLCVPMAPVMAGFYVWGKRIRGRSRFT